MRSIIGQCLETSILHTLLLRMQKLLKESHTGISNGEHGMCMLVHIGVLHSKSRSRPPSLKQRQRRLFFDIPVSAFQSNYYSKGVRTSPLLYCKSLAAAVSYPSQPCVQGMAYNKNRIKVHSVAMGTNAVNPLWSQSSQPWHIVLTADLTLMLYILVIPIIIFAV